MMQITKTQFCFHFLPKFAFNKNKNNITKKKRNFYLNNYTKLKEKKNLLKVYTSGDMDWQLCFSLQLQFNFLFKRTNQTPENYNLILILHKYLKNTFFYIIFIN